MATDTVLLESPDLFFAELNCPPDDPDWGEDNVVMRTIVALPAAPVWQAHDGAERQLMNQNNVVLHHPGSEYRRERFRDVGYRCLFLIPVSSLARQVASEVDPAAADSAVVRFKNSSGPLDASTFRLSRMAARYLKSPQADPTPAREVLYEVLRGAVRASDPGAPPDRPARSAATRQARREMVEGAKEMLVDRMAERISLDELAGRMYTTPYHLARVFRAGTGFSVHGYLVHLRLRTAFDRLPQDADDVGQVGRALGYRSHSHFTASFRRTFGIPPSRVPGSVRALALN
jgi:AraC family transcriptional regulator